MKKDRLGLAMVSASILVIGLIIGLLIQYAAEERVEQIRTQGIGLVRVLSRLPVPTLAPETGAQSALDLTLSTQSSPDFAYGAVTNAEGETLAEVTAGGVVVPRVKPGAAPTEWFGERRLNGLDQAQRFREFHAPLLDAGQLVGHVRIGYRDPGFGINAAQFSQLGVLALPIFLLTPLFYFFIQREIRPLRDANLEIQGMLADQPIHRVELELPGEAGDFVRNFNRIIQAAESRIQDLESHHTEMLTSSKVLSYRKARVESVLESIPEGIVVLDEVGTVGYVNHRLEALMGLKPEALIGGKVHEWCSSPEILAFLANYTGRVAHRNEAGRIEVVPSGAPEKHISLSAYPLYLPRDEAEIYGTLVVFHDISREVLARKARSDFVAHLSHELKTPLQVIGMYGELLLGEDGRDEAMRVEAANTINDQVERIAALISGMLDMTQIELGDASPNRVRVKLSDMLNDTFANLSNNAREADIQMILELPRELPSIFIDKDRFRVALNNLLSNAIKYNRSGGKVTLSVREDDSSLHVVVKDTGLGISAEDQKRVFDKFYRSSDEAVRERTGQGLGLALARQIVELHNGVLSLTSVPGEGSTFSIILPKSPVLLREESAA